MTDAITAATLRVVHDNMNLHTVEDISVVYLSEALWNSHLVHAAYRDRILSLECAVPAAVPATLHGRGGSATFGWMFTGTCVSARIEVGREWSAEEAFKLLVDKIDGCLREVASRARHELNLSMEAAQLNGRRH